MTASAPGREPLSDMRARAAQRREIRRLSTQAMVLSAEANNLAMSEDAQQVAGRDPAVAQRLARLVTRGRAVQKAAVDLERPEKRSGATEGGEKPLTAAMESLDPDEFKRRVQIRRRMDALRKRRQRAAQKPPARSAARTEFDPEDAHLRADPDAAP